MTNSGRLPSPYLAPARHYEPRSKVPSLPIPISAEDARASEHFASAASLHARASDAALRDYLCGNQIAGAHAIDAVPVTARSSSLIGLPTGDYVMWRRVGSPMVSPHEDETSPRAKAPSRSPSPTTVAFDLTPKLDGEDVLFALDV